MNDRGSNVMPPARYNPVRALRRFTDLSGSKAGRVPNASGSDPSQTLHRPIDLPNWGDEPVRLRRHSGTLAKGCNLADRGPGGWLTSAGCVSAARRPGGAAASDGGYCPGPPGIPRSFGL